MALPHKGRTKGTPNKVGREVKEAFLMAFARIGGIDALTEWAMDPDNRTDFFKLLSKLLPTEVHADVNVTLPEVLQRAEERLLTMRPKTEVDEDGKSVIVH